MPKGMTRLPNELIIDIINRLATQIHELAYIYPPLVLPTLLNLALVSHAVSTWSMPFIYNRIVITTPKQLQILYHSLCDRPAEQRRTVQAFAIISPDDDTYDIRNGNPERICQICGLLDSMSSSLQRLIIDLPFTHLLPYMDDHVRTPIRAALLHLPHIVEFINIRDDLLSRTRDPADFLWTSWTSLRRLALYDYVNAHFAYSTQGLERIPLFALNHYANGNLGTINHHSFNLKTLFLLEQNLLGLADVKPVFEAQRELEFSFYIQDDISEEGIQVDRLREARMRSWYQDHALQGLLWNERDWDKGVWRYFDSIIGSFRD